MRRIRSYLGLALASVAVLSGCGGEARDATSKELASLTAEIARMRTEQATLGQRLSALERGKAPPPAPVASETRTEPASASPVASAVQRSLDSDRPSLDVVRLGPSTDLPEDASNDVDADGPRTVLRSGANGIIVEEAGPGGAAGAGDAGAAKKTAKRSDSTFRRKTASVSTP